jgi:glutamyl-Q tRNA(Asp) synthetase
VTHVTRGRDLYFATSLHRLLQTLLGLPEPLYHHHRLLAGADGQKLSKSAGDTSLRALREKGVDQLQIRQHIGLLGS